MTTQPTNASRNYCNEQQYPAPIECRRFFYVRVQPPSVSSEKRMELKKNNIHSRTKYSGRGTSDKRNNIYLNKNVNEPHHNNDDYSKALIHTLNRIVASISLTLHNLEPLSNRKLSSTSQPFYQFSNIDGSFDTERCIWICSCTVTIVANPSHGLTVGTIRFGVRLCRQEDNSLTVTPDPQRISPQRPSSSSMSSTNDGIECPNDNLHKCRGVNISMTSEGTLTTASASSFDSSIDNSFAEESDEQQHQGMNITAASPPQTIGSNIRKGGIRSTHDNSSCCTNTNFCNEVIQTSSVTVQISYTTHDGSMDDGCNPSVELYILEVEAKQDPYAMTVTVAPGDVNGMDITYQELASDDSCSNCLPRFKSPLIDASFSESSEPMTTAKIKEEKDPNHCPAFQKRTSTSETSPSSPCQIQVNEGRNTADCSKSTHAPLHYIQDDKEDFIQMEMVLLPQPPFINSPYSPRLIPPLAKSIRLECYAHLVDVVHAALLRVELPDFPDGWRWRDIGATTTVNTSRNDSVNGSNVADAHLFESWEHDDDVDTNRGRCSSSVSSTGKRSFNYFYSCSPHDELQRGSFSTVYRVVHRKSGMLYAAKVISRTNLSPKDDVAILEEVAILTSLACLDNNGDTNGSNNCAISERIVTLHDFFVEELHYIMVMEYMWGGDLYDFLNRRRVSNISCDNCTNQEGGQQNECHNSNDKDNTELRQQSHERSHPTILESQRKQYHPRLLKDSAPSLLSLIYNERDAATLSRNLLEIICFCHSKNIAHLDIKPKNLLLVNEHDGTNIKLADFGFAKRIMFPESLYLPCGTPYYVAPEIIQKKLYDQAADMWSAGILIYLLLFGSVPFTAVTKTELYEKICEAQVFKHSKCGNDNDSGGTRSENGMERISHAAKDLICGLLCVDPAERLTAREALQCDWIRGISNGDDNEVKTHNLKVKSKVVI
eukprot:CAMPEP_0194373432 /NCGR_PEP_ID=MMETSP0174-20130528/21867_1 /TAXON_ID=216777 /ORGANISM="Proboscia alata, Strain PI-D3" /LENGTH=942 /DNA_ID=CAMNT_0039152497 /DNA_START=230 /DNA_END=3058 /DNA_ORIENTATION=-